MLRKDQSHERHDVQAPHIVNDKVVEEKMTQTHLVGMALLSEEPLRFIQDNLRLLKIPPNLREQINDKLEKVIYQTVEVKHKGEDAYQDISVVNQNCLDAVKSAMEAIIYLTGTPLLNRIAQHVSKQFIEDNNIDNRKVVFKNTLHIIDQLIQCPFAYLHCVDLLYLTDHVADLNLDAGTEQSYRENLSVVISERLSAIEIILKSAKVLAVNYINGEVL